MSRQYMRLVHKKDLTVDDTGRLLIEDLAQAYMTREYILSIEERNELLAHTSLQWQALHSACNVFQERYSKLFYALLLNLQQYELQGKEALNKYSRDYPCSVFEPVYREDFALKYKQYIAIEIAIKYMAKISKVKNLPQALTNINYLYDEEDITTNEIKERGMTEGYIVPTFNKLQKDFAKALKNSGTAIDTTPLFLFSDKVKYRTYRAVCTEQRFAFENMQNVFFYNDIQGQSARWLDKYHEQEQRKQ